MGDLAEKLFDERIWLESCERHLTNKTHIATVRKLRSRHMPYGYKRCAILMDLFEHEIHV